MMPTPTSPGALLVREINQMEREMCSYLEWQLNVEPGALKELESMVRRDFKGSRSVSSSLHSPSSFLRAICAPEAEHEQHTHCHPILWSWRATISPIRDLHSPSGKVITKVVSRLVSYPNGRSPASHSPRLALERPLPSQLDVARHPTELRGRQRNDCLLH